MGTIPVEDTGGDYDLTGTGSIVFTYGADRPMDVRVCILVGTDAKPSVMLAGTWVLYVWVTRSGNTEVYAVEPYPQSYRCGVNKCKFFTTKVVDIENGDSITVAISSPNEGDTDVTVYASMVQVLAAIPEARPGAAHGIVTFGTGAGQINPDGTGKVTVGTNSDKTGYGLADGAITADKLAANAITAAKIADAALAIAKFAADVGSTAYASNPVAQAVDKGVTNYDPPTNTEMEARTLAAAAYATAVAQDEIKTAVGLVGNSEDTIENSESQVYNTDTADGSTVVNEET